MKVILFAVCSVFLISCSSTPLDKPAAPRVPIIGMPWMSDVVELTPSK